MGCANSQSRYRVSAYTNGLSGSGNGVFVPASPSMPTNDITEARMHLQLTGADSQFRVQRAFRYSDDNISWNSANTVGSAVTPSANEWDYGTWGPISAPATPLQYVQFGFWIYNSSGTDRLPAQLVMWLQTRAL